MRNAETSGTENTGPDEPGRSAPGSDTLDIARKQRPPNPQLAKEAHAYATTAEQDPPLEMVSGAWWAGAC
jgi:hypothetical protein